MRGGFEDRGVATEDAAEVRRPQTPERPPIASWRRGESKLSPLLDPDTLRSIVEALARDTMAGRPTPSPALEAAAQYIAARFRRAGLGPSRHKPLQPGRCRLAS